MRKGGFLLKWGGGGSGTHYMYWGPILAKMRYMLGFLKKPSSPGLFYQNLMIFGELSPPPLKLTLGALRTTKGSEGRE